MKFKKFLASNKFILFDGGLGTLLQKKGLPSGESPEAFAWHNSEVLMNIHAEYVQAGADVITTNTFGGNRYKLPAGLDVFELNKKMALLARQACGNKSLVAGSIGPTGKILKPLGDVSFLELVDVFVEQIRGLVAGGVDLILGETHFDLAEARAVVIAAKKVCPHLPVGISMTFEGKNSLTGTTPTGFVLTMLNLDVDFVSINCSLGPKELVPMVQEMLTVSPKPLLVEPNAGLPVLENGQTVFKLSPEDFAAQMIEFAKMGIKCLGGCCGTTPAHIARLADALKQIEFKPQSPARHFNFGLTSRSKYVLFGGDEPTVLIGERINPTGKQKLASQLQVGDISYALKLAEEQLQAKAKVLDVNVGAPLVEEEKILPKLGFELVKRYDPLICFDSNNIDAIYKSLPLYPGSPLINSISGETGRLERLGPLCRDYGAPFILLPLKGKKLPVTAKERIVIIEELVKRCEDLKIPRHLILVDVLALTVSSKPEAAKACLEVIAYCKKHNLPTTIGLSNISFGLPARELLNSTFLAMAISWGLSSCIVNPNSSRIQEVFYASNVLLDRDKQASEFVSIFSHWQSSTNKITHKTQPAELVTTPKQAVIVGDKERLISLLKEALKKKKAFEILNQELIPAITEVGDKYEKKEYFLPQLLLSAEAMQAGVTFLEPWLKEEKNVKGPKIIMATVEGDIHDIGKNIVCLMLKNHGFEVIDLGKDVPAQKIVEVAQKEQADLIGLSALMTTTMIKMEETIKLVKKYKLKCRVMVGGAVVTETFARQIGADGYSEDAVAAVNLAKKLTK
ncbi:MAG: homocysteine S-methyltransferase family protein [Desulfonauticus sp.]|nr:homocysteine S-methyltransferase family protein [Desulfonauticus sp.]